jgi:hypothetical protein
LGTGDYKRFLVVHSMEPPAYQNWLSATKTMFNWWSLQPHIVPYKFYFSKSINKYWHESVITSTCEAKGREREHHASPGGKSQSMAFLILLVHCSLASREVQIN